ncbi:MAG: toxin-antitoxin system, antitoxin component [Leptospirales bacterium]
MFNILHIGGKHIMGQLSIYIDNETLKKVEQAAENESVSVSKWITSRLKNSFQTNWDESFFSLYGSINDSSFKRPEQISYEHDSKRETL